MSSLIPNPKFSKLASDEQVEKTARALEASNMQVIVVASGAEARQKALELLPDGAEVFNATSRTLDAIGLSDDINKSSRFNSVRNRFSQMDPKIQAGEMRKLGAGPDYVVGSVHAVTEQGQVLIASATGSQLASYVYGAGKVIWVVGTQKIVANLDEGNRRIYEYSYPLEDARARQVYGVGSNVGKILIVNREAQAGRITVILVKENLGF